MYFKQIEIIGFKSFADRTVINLEPGMTSVVGPNGCGKSNILDALRWALGEQSAKSLRGSHMQDVIFNGSEDRVATGMAEVSLFFDNSDSVLPVDFSEVQVTRRVFRSGESEYLINKSLCRLRDIHELFMDTGIGTNAYSMIGQGQISLVLSSKPEDRRTLFEEAAGIIKYKSRKKVALRKLDYAEQNLLRLGDIIAEIQRQMRSLKRQVNAAIRYRELSDTLKEFEVRAAWLKRRELFGRIEGLREQFKTAQDSYEKGSAELSRLEARFEEQGLAKLEVDRVLHTRREGVHEIENEMANLERQIALIRQQIEFSEGQAERAREEEQEFNARAAAIEEEQRQTAGRVEALQEERQAGEGGIEAKRGEHEQSSQRVADGDAQLEAERARAEETASRRAENQTAIETLSVSVANIETQLEAIYERQNADGQRHEELVKGLEGMKRDDAGRQAALARIEDERQNAGRQEEDLSREIGEVNERWQALRERKSSVEARLGSLRELRDSYEGFATGVRAIMQAKQKNDPRVEGIIGPVGDLVSTDKPYERAIEAALGGNINNVAVDSAEAAKSAIEFLKEERAGRVTFLPLDVIRTSSRDDAARVQGFQGVIGPAIDHVRFDEHVSRAMEYLFRNTVIVETIDDAIHIARTASAFPRLVTIDGEVVSSMGAVTGGRTRHEGRGILGRSAEIDELEEQLTGVEKDIGALTEQAQQQAQAIEALKETSRRLADDEAAQRHGLNELGVEIARHSTELANLAQAAEALNNERESLCARRDDHEAERREALEKAGAMESEEDALQRAIADALETASRARETQSVLAGELTDLRVALAGMIQTLEESERDHQRLFREHGSALAESQRRSASIEEFKANEVSLEKETKDHVERLKAFSETQEEARKEVVEAENERQGLLDESEQLEKDIRGAREGARESQGAVHKLEIDLRHDEDQFEFFEERMLSEYNIVLGTLTAEEVGTDEYDDDAREKLVNETRSRLDRMGSVNLMAIEEYEALTERNDFLVSQNDDLQKAREALLGVVSRIDKTIEQMFLDVFRAVSENFRQYFRRLFNGGQARIYLLDEDDPLESGIEIEARPPGKKPQSISLLSGGEQAMTAIALLFSLFKAKPSPFCVLDEVDAPLDDANIGRFLTMLEEFSKDTQFVVITHNKQTMARADILYGVTMQERGVSKIVSVKLDEVPEEAEPAA